MHCEQCETILALLALNELDADRKAAVEAHVADCPTCSGKLADLRATLNLLNEAVERMPEMKLSDERRAALAGAIKKEAANAAPPSPPRWNVLQFRLPRRPARIAAGIALCVVAAALVLPSLTPAREQARRRMPSRDGLHEKALEQDAKFGIENRVDTLTSSPRASIGYEDFFSGETGAVGGDRPTAEKRSFVEMNGSGSASQQIGGSINGSINGLTDDEYAVLLGDRQSKMDPELPLGATLQLKLNPEIGAARPSPKPLYVKIGERLVTNISPSEAAAANREAKEGGVTLDSDISVRWTMNANAKELPMAKESLQLAENKEERAVADSMAAADYRASLSVPSTQIEDRWKDGLPAKTTGRAANRASGPVTGAAKDRNTHESGLRETKGDISIQETTNGQTDTAAAKLFPAPSPAPSSTPTDKTSAPIFHAGPVNPWVMTTQDALSTFAIDVDTASYAIARSYIARGSLPPAASVRMEEFVNAFDYNYPTRASGVFSVHAEAGQSPFGPGLTLLKVGVRARVAGREARRPANLVFVVDASGSMERPDRIPLVKYALRTLLDQLAAEDRVSIISFGTQPTLVIENAPVSEKARIVAAMEGLSCGGSTNLFDGLKLGYEMAARGFRSGAINRVVLCSDGVANVGGTEAETMLKGVESFRKQGITFTAVGFGHGTYDDALLEQLADRGDGNYVFVDSTEEAHRVFVDEMAATLQTVAKDAKIQVAFDPARVRRYRLVGFEDRDIADADFRNDAVVAGGVGSGQSSTALYELELVADDEPLRARDLGVAYVRYRDVETERIEEISCRLSADIVRKRGPEDSPRFLLAACAAEFAEILRGSEHARDTSFRQVVRMLEPVAAQLPLDGRVQELLTMVRKAEGLPRAQ